MFKQYHIICPDNNSALIAYIAGGLTGFALKYGKHWRNKPMFSFETDRIKPLRDVENFVNRLCSAGVVLAQGLHPEWDRAEHKNSKKNVDAWLSLE